MTLARDHVLGGYRLIECLGRGSQAEVWRARPGDRLPDVALKILAKGDDEARLRLEREARMLTRLEGGVTARLLSQWEWEGRLVLELELLRGLSLSVLLKRRRLSLAEVDALIPAVGDCLSQTHHEGILHRDLKPSNIILEDSDPRGRVRLIDFGASAWAHQDEELPELRSSVIGTPGYMSPEQMQSHGALDGRTDLFSLGVLAYRLLTGRMPFQGRTLRALWEQQYRGQFAPLQRLHPELPQRIVALVHACLSLSPSERPHDAASFSLAWRGERPLRTSAALLPESSEIEPDTLVLEGLSSKGPESAARLSREDRFFGRGKELAEIVALLASQSHPRLSLKGPAGVGKSRIARQLLQRRSDILVHEIWYCDLVSARSRAEIGLHIAASLGIPITQQDGIQQLTYALQTRAQVLLVLDNVERASEELRGILDHWLLALPQLRVVTTSRVSLGVQEEALVTVDPFGLEDALRFFEERAQRVVPDFQLGEEERERLKRMMNNLDRLPLTLEMAASQLYNMSLEELERELEERFSQMLQHSTRGATSRQQSLRGALDVSWGLLKPWEQAALQQCSVFRGGFTLEAAEGILDLSAFSQAPWVMDLLQTLVEHSLLQILEPASGLLRYRLLEWVRIYAQEKREAGRQKEQEQALRLRHAEYYASFGHLEQLERAERLPELKAHLTQRLERENFLAARSWCRATDRLDEAARCTLALSISIGQVGPYEGIVALLDETLVQGGLSPLVEAECLIRSAFYWTRLQREDSVEAHLQRALALAEEAGEGWVLAFGTCSLANFYFHRGRGEEGEQLARQAEDRFARLGSPSGQLKARMIIALLHQHQGRNQEAGALYRELLVWCDEHQLRGERKNLLINLSNVLQNLGHPREALEMMEEALRLSRAAEDRRGEGILQGNMGVLYFEQRAWSAAMSCFQASYALHRAMGNLFSCCICLSNIGETHYQMGDLQEARSALREALEQAGSAWPLIGGSVRGSLAMVELKLNEVELAEQLLIEGEALLRDSSPVELVKLLCKRGRLELRLRRVESARALEREITDLVDPEELGGEHDLKRLLKELREGIAAAEPV